MPRTKKAGRTLRVLVGLKTSSQNVKGDAHGIGFRLQITAIGTVVDVGHSDVQGFNLESTTRTLHGVSKQIEQGERIFSARQSYEDMVARYDKFELSNTCHEAAFHSLDNLMVVIHNGLSEPTPERSKIITEKI